LAILVPPNGVVSAQSVGKGYKRWLPGVYLTSRTLLVKQDETLFESYVLEIMRYEAELEAMGLSSSDGQEEERTRDILNSLGFDTGDGNLMADLKSSE
jgi:hypothetical protein